MKKPGSVKPGSKKNGRPQTGFSLVEVLIALVVMSVGMLGIAGLYVQSMQAGRTSTFRHNAITLAGDIADRVRANPFAGAAYGTAVAASVNCITSGTNCAAGANNNCIDGGTDCSADAMADSDILLWQAQASDSLPRGRVAIVFTAGGVGAPPTYQITVAWDEPGETPTRSYGITIPVLAI